jgi:uridine phosphorylase
MGAVMPSAPIVLKPHEPVAERVLLPGDPGRALRLATQLIDGPRMLNHHRGLWGYSGPARDGAPLTIQSTGLGGPSAVAVVGELVALGARRLVRVGTAAGLGATPLGSIVVADAALAGDGASRAIGAGERVTAAARLTRAIAEACASASVTAARGLVASADIHDPVAGATWERAGAIAFDLATAAVLATAHRHGVTAAALVGITRARGERLGDDALEPLEAALGAAALAALAPAGSQAAAVEP